VRYDESGIHRVYDAARRLSPEGLAFWSGLLADLFSGARVARVLDVGCGTGRFLPLLREVLGGAVVGVDPSADMLSVAAEKDVGDRIHLIRALAGALPVRTASMDLVFVHLVYHHITDKTSALREWKRVLSPDGALFICSPTVELLESYLWMRFFPTAVRIDSERMPSRAKLISEVAEAGFRLQRHETVTRPYTRTLTEYVDRIAQRALSTLRLIPDEEFETGLAALRRHCGVMNTDRPVSESLDIFLFHRRT
jgi:ubiquinone/menaquinone biosynthesis C-methylase UbiE